MKADLCTQTLAGCMPAPLSPVVDDKGNSGWLRGVVASEDLALVGRERSDGYCYEEPYRLSSLTLKE